MIKKENAKQIIRQELSFQERAELIYEIEKDNYETQPVDIMTFVNDEYYLGGTYGGKLFEIWQETLKEIYPIPYFSPYYEVVLSACIGAGKCLAKGTKVLMYDGSIKSVEKIKTGELLMGDDSTARVVLSTCRGKENMYRISPIRGGEPFVCNESHILSLKHKDTGEISNISVRDYLKASIEYKTYYELYRVAVEFPTQDNYPFDPYLFGKKWNKRHRIPATYLYANKKTRFLVVEGLLDKGVTLRKNCWKISNLFKGVSEDYAFLAGSLGYIVTRKPMENNKKYEVIIEKQDNWTTPFEVEPQGVGEYYGFEIDGNRLFLLGDFTVTHNTSCSTIGMLYDIHKLLCLKNPQEYYNLTRNTTIAFALFSATLSLASDVNWTSLQDAMRVSPYFMAKVTDKKALDAKGKTTLIPLAKNIGIQIGSKFTHTIGKAVFGALLDEASFQNNTAAGNQAQDTYAALLSRSESRFSNPDGVNLLPGHLWLASSPSKSTEFLDGRIQAASSNKAILVKKDIALWHAKKHLMTDDVFYVFAGDSENKAEIVDDVNSFPPEKRHLIHPVPTIFRHSFEEDLILNIMDKLGISTTSPDNLFTNTTPIKSAMAYENPFDVDVITDLSFAGSDQIMSHMDKDYFRNIRYPEYNRFIMLDAGLKEDIFGISAVYCKPYKDTISDEETAFEFDNRLYFNDFTIGIKAKKGEKINFSKIESFISYLLKVMKYPIAQISADSFQSENTLQKFELMGLNTSNISVVKTLLPYRNLRDKVLEGKMFLVRSPKLVQELSELKLVAGKSGKLMYDHPSTGSKDLSDTVAGALSACMASTNIVNRVRITRDYLKDSLKENPYAEYESMTDEEFLDLLQSQGGSTLG